MSNKSDRSGPETVKGRLAGEPEHSQVHDEALNPGVSINGAQPLVGPGDIAARMVKVHCTCGSLIAEVWMNDRRKRTGLDSFLSVVGLVIVDHEARPVKTKHFEQLVRAGRTVVTDCVAHGRHHLRGARLIRESGHSARIYQQRSESPEPLRVRKIVSHPGAS